MFISHLVSMSKYDRPCWVLSESGTEGFDPLSRHTNDAQSGSLGFALLSLALGTNELAKSDWLAHCPVSTTTTHIWK